MPKDEEKKPKVEKVEQVITYRIGNILATGFPTEVETLTAGGGKVEVKLRGVQGEISGEKYSKVKYKWIYYGGKMSPEEVHQVTEVVTNASGTIASSVEVSTAYESFQLCDNCQGANPISAKYCNHCGHKQ